MRQKRELVTEDKMMENKETEKKRDKTTTGSQGENSIDKWYQKAKQY